MSRKQTSRGVSTIEFAFISVFLIPLLLGTIGIGINLITMLQSVQLARDAGSMFARNVDFSKTGNLVLLTTVGAPVGLTTSTSTSQATLILSSVTYVDPATCVAGGDTLDAGGNPQNCPNYKKWVFTQQLVIPSGSTKLTSHFGTPSSAIMDSTGTILPAKYISDGSAVVNSTFSGINPYKNTSGVISGLPSGQKVYISEDGLPVFAMPPFVGGGGAIYSCTFF